MQMNNGVLETGPVDSRMETLHENAKETGLNPRGIVIEATAFNKLLNHFEYHAPSEGQKPCYVAINEAAKTLALTIVWNTPAGPDQTAAIRKVVEAKMTANSAIATNPEQYK